MTAEELLRAIAIANTVCRHAGHRLEGTATLMRCGGWTFAGRCEHCGLGGIQHFHSPGSKGPPDHDVRAG